MSKQRAGNVLLNLVLVGLGLAALVLVYALVTRSLSAPADPSRDANPTELVGDIIQVEVRNGCGVAGVAETVMHYLRRKGFDVVMVGNHTSFDQAQTRVVDRVGNPEAAQKVAAALGLPADRVEEEVQLDYYLDASVIIGQDYASLPPFAEDGEAAQP